MPETEPDRHERPKQSRDAYDKANITILTFTLLAAFTAAGFTGWQAWIARDQEHRALRAYIVVSAELIAESQESGAYVKFTVENMGQTPVYDLSFEITNETVKNGGGVSTVESDFLKYNCADRARSLLNYDWSNTFSKNYYYNMGISSFGVSNKTIDPLLADNRKIITRGTVCYRDIFRESHAYRLCYEWVGPGSNPTRCAYSADDSQAD